MLAVQVRRGSLPCIGEPALASQPNAEKVRLPCDRFCSGATTQALQARLSTLRHSWALRLRRVTNDMLKEDRGAHHCDEELAAVGVLAGVGHGQHAWLVVLHCEVLVGEFGAVYALTASAGVISEVTTCSLSTFIH